MAPVVEVRGLVNRFGGQVVHDGLDMRVDADEVFGIVGGSGAGKSVLLRTILGLQRPQRRYRAASMAAISRAFPRRSCARSRPATASPSRRGLCTRALTVLQNVQLPMLEYLKLPADALDDLARLKIRLVGLPEEAAGKYPAQLSGGMVKRAAAGARPGARSARCCSSTSRPRASTRSARPRSTTWCCTCSST